MYIVISMKRLDFVAWAQRGRRSRHRTVYKYMCYQSVRKRKYIPCFEVGLSPKGLIHPKNKVYTFAFHRLACITIQCVRYYKMLKPPSKQSIYFRFPRACVRNYTMHALLQNVCTTTKYVRYYKRRALLKMCAQLQSVCAMTGDKKAVCLQY